MLFDTSITKEGECEIAAWPEQHGIKYLDGLDSIICSTSYLMVFHNHIFAVKS